MENIYEICFYGGLVLAILLLIVSVVLFIVLKIPKVIGDLTGRSAKKSIKEMKEGAATKESASKKEQAKYYNQSSGQIKVREGISTAKRKEKQDDTTDLLSPDQMPGMEETEVLGAEKNSYDPEETEVLGATDRAYDPEETEVLSSEKPTVNEEETEVLTATTDDEETAVLTSDDEETAVLTSVDDEETAVLTSDDEETAVLTSAMDEEATDVLRAPDIDDEGATTVLAAGMDASKLASKVKVELNVVITHTDETLEGGKR